MQQLYKQLLYYYRHKQERLQYQKNYYQKHKQTILQHKKQRYQQQQVKRTKNNIRFIRYIDCIVNKYYYKLLREQNTYGFNNYFSKMFTHKHGRPKEFRYDNVADKRNLYVHLIPELNVKINMLNENEYEIYNEHTHFINFDDHVEGLFFGNKPERERNKWFNMKELTKQIAHCLGFNYGDSISYKCPNGKTEQICFDRSGLDLCNPEALSQLMELRIEKNIKGIELLSFWQYYNGLTYVKLWRGNKIKLTTEPNSMIKAYLQEISLTT